MPPISDSLWTVGLNGMVGWEIVEAFLAARIPEAPRVEYRERFDPSGGGAARRFVDTVAAMANVGGGLILFGVGTNRQNIPDRWPTLAVDGLTPGALYSSVRAYLEPPISIEMGVARKAGEGDIVVVRVPDAPQKPVFVSDRGVLVRLGESNVPARPAQLAAWFGAQSAQIQATEAELYRAAPQLINVSRPLVEIAIGPHETWSDAAWGDEVDVRLTTEVHRRFDDVSGPHVSADLVQFRHLSPKSPHDLARWVWFKPSGVMLRLCELQPDDEGRLSALVVAGQVHRAWLLALAAIPVILPGYSSSLSMVVSLGGVEEAGFRSDYPMTSRLQSVPPLENRQSWWQGVRLGLPQHDEDFDLLRHLMQSMLRTFGYTPSEPVARELAAHAVWKEAEPPPIEAG